MGRKGGTREGQKMNGRRAVQRDGIREWQKVNESERKVSGGEQWAGRAEGERDGW